MEIQSKLFNRMPHLEKLNLAKNRLKLVGQTFMGLKKLKFLDLSENNLTLETYGTFASLAKLETLNLAYNSIARIDAYTFKGLTSLQSLCLRRNFFDENFRIDVFERMTNSLQLVDLSEIRKFTKELEEKLIELYRSKIDFIFDD